MMKAPEIMRAKVSATVTAHQIPSSPMIRGRSSTARVWYAKVRRNEIAANGDCRRNTAIIQSGEKGGSKYIYAVQYKGKRINDKCISGYVKKHFIISYKNMGEGN